MFRLGAPEVRGGFHASSPRDPLAYAARPPARLRPPSTATGPPARAVSGSSCCPQKWLSPAKAVLVSVRIPIAKGVSESGWSEVLKRIEEALSVDAGAAEREREREREYGVWSGNPLRLRGARQDRVGRPPGDHGLPEPTEDSVADAREALAGKCQSSACSSTGAGLFRDGRPQTGDGGPRNDVEASPPALLSLATTTRFR